LNYWYLSGPIKKTPTPPLLSLPVEQTEHYPLKGRGKSRGIILNVHTFSELKTKNRINNPIGIKKALSALASTKLKHFLSKVNK